MATHRGMDGSLTWAGGVVGELKQWTLNTSVEIFDTTPLNVAWQTNRGGLASWTGTAQVQLDYADTAQRAIVDAVMAATPPGTPVAIVFRVTATKTFSGTAIVTSLSTGAQGGSLVLLDVTFTGSGALTPAWA
jgi:hypothetical protein